MSAKHRTPEYNRNAPIIRARVKAAWRAGRFVGCWRCGGEIPPNTAFDVGHLPGAEASRLDDMAPEHRHRTGRCIGNRVAGGREGAAKTNGRRRPNTITKGQEKTWAL